MGPIIISSLILISCCCNNSGSQDNISEWKQPDTSSGNIEFCNLSPVVHVPGELNVDVTNVVKCGMTELYIASDLGEETTQSSLYLGNIKANAQGRVAIRIPIEWTQVGAIKGKEFKFSSGKKYRLFLRVERGKQVGATEFRVE